MSIPLLIANALTILAFLIHTFVGDKEIRILEPKADSENYLDKREKWTMARCGWHWVSFDLLFAGIGLSLINFTDHFQDERTILQLLALYFFGYGVFWLITILISKSFPQNFLKLGQWILLFLISGLIYLSIN